MKSCIRHFNIFSGLTLSTLLVFSGIATSKNGKAFHIKAQEFKKETVASSITSEIGDMNGALHKILDEVLENGVSVVSEIQEIEDDQNVDPAKSKYSVDDFIIETDHLDFDRLGNQKGSVTITSKTHSMSNDSLYLETTDNQTLSEVLPNIRYTFDVEVEMKDEQAPIIDLVYQQISIDIDEEINPDEWLSAIYDDVDGEITDYEFDDSGVDNTTAGEYEAYYTATDSSGNSSSRTLVVKVVDHATYYQPAPAVASFSVRGSGASGSISEMAALINQARAAYGRAPLTLDTGSLGAAAQVRAAEASTYVAHIRPNGTPFSTVLSEYGVSYSNRSEILTYAGTTAQDGLNWWLSSPAHSAALLNGSFTRIGIGYYNGMWCGLLIG